MNISSLVRRLFATLAVSGTFVVSAGAASAASTTPDDVDATDESKPKPLRPHQSILGAQAFWAVDKVMPGVTLRLDLHERVWLDIEGGLVFVTNPPPGNDSLVGGPFGAHVLAAPLRTRSVELGAGLGADVHYLWGVNGDIVEVALALLVSAHYWVTPKLALFGSARVYPVHTSGLDLGEFRDGSRGLPVLFATGVAWSIQ